MALRSGDLPTHDGPDKITRRLFMPVALGKKYSGKKALSIFLLYIKFYEIVKSKKSLLSFRT
jgi:hypothetical protein